MKPTFVHVIYKKNNGAPPVVVVVCDDSHLEEVLGDLRLRSKDPSSGFYSDRFQLNAIYVAEMF